MIGISHPYALLHAARTGSCIVHRSYMIDMHSSSCVAWHDTLRMCGVPLIVACSGRLQAKHQRLFLHQNQLFLAARTLLTTDYR